MGITMVEDKLEEIVAELEMEESSQNVANKQPQRVVSSTEETNKQFELIQEKLKEKNNRLGEKDLNYFLINHSTRVKEQRNNLLLVREYLEVLANIQQDENIDTEKLFDKSTSFYTLGASTVYNYVNSIYGTTTKRAFYDFRSRILPFCCGVSEYGAFQFTDYTKVPEQLVFNLILDLIRLTAHGDRVRHSGAMSLINYFTDNGGHLGFMKVLESRDDLTFIRDFTNPKTRHTLKMFLFNTQI